LHPKHLFFIKRIQYSNTTILLLIPLTLSAFIHLWNLDGFPTIHFDEGVYILRAMYILSGEGPQILYHPYDHPYFGQIFLAAMLKAIAYPDSLNPSEDGTGRTTETRHYMYSVKMLYLLPRMRDNMKVRM